MTETRFIERAPVRPRARPPQRRTLSASCIACPPPTGNSCPRTSPPPPHRRHVTAPAPPTTTPPPPPPPPRYQDALRRAAGGESQMAKMHGFPQYPDKVMAEADVGNYVAWARVYPYCPLSQLQPEGAPVRLPPRGFTPTPRPTPAPLKPVDADALRRDAKRD